MKSCDVGSLPFNDDVGKLHKGAAKYGLSSSDENVQYFQTKVIEGFVQKADSGINIPFYPQFRDMNWMFLEMLDGVEKVKRGYIESKAISLKSERKSIPEVGVIRESSKEISEALGQPFEFGLCITGPYTLSSHFVAKDSGIFLRLGRAISKIIENSIFNGRYGRISLVAVDEPLFGVLDDPLIDCGSPGRENLRQAWEIIFSKADSHSLETCVHLHSTADSLFWDIKSLKIVESEMNNSLYQNRSTKQLLESHDKFLKANVCIADFEQLLRKKIGASFKCKMNEYAVNQKIAEIWKKILNHKLDPRVFLEDVTLIRKRIINLVDKYGAERVLYVGPECGLRSFPNTDLALECLKRLAIAATGL